MVYSTGGKIEFNDYNTLITDINKLFGTGTGDYGYGGNSTNVALANLPTLIKGNLLTNEDWLDLRNSIEDMATHQGTTLQDALPSAAEIIDGNPGTIYSNLNSATNISDLIANRHVADGVPTTTVKLNDTLTKQWRTLVQFRFNIDFDDSDHARHFFNTGGSIQLSITRSGGTSHIHNTSWTDLLNQGGAYTFDREAYFALSQNYTTYRETVLLDSSVYSWLKTRIRSAHWTVNAKFDDIQGLNKGNGSKLVIETNLLDKNRHGFDFLDGNLAVEVSERKYDSVFNIKSPQFSISVNISHGERHLRDFFNRS